MFQGQKSSQTEWGGGEQKRHLQVILAFLELSLLLFELLSQLFQFALIVAVVENFFPVLVDRLGAHFTHPDKEEGPNARLKTTGARPFALVREKISFESFACDSSNPFQKEKEREAPLP